MISAWQLIDERPMASSHPCVICGRTKQRPFVRWFVSLTDGSITCGACVEATKRTLMEVSMRRQTLIVAGPTKPATLTAILPLVTYAFDRILGHIEGAGSRVVTLKQVQAISRSVCLEHGAAHLADNVIAAVNAAIDSMLGGAVSDSEPGPHDA